MRKSIITIMTVALLSVVAASCRKSVNSDVVARVYNHYLYRSDIEQLTNENQSTEDSLAVVNNFINKWIQQMVVLEKAFRNVDNDFEQELQNYKNSLVTYEYERLVIRQNLDTIVSDEEIRQYYDDHKDDFTLASNILKTFYLKLPNGNTSIAKLQKILNKASIDGDDMDQIQKIAAINASSYNFETDNWMSFQQLQEQVPIDTYNETLFLRTHKSITITDNGFTYLVRILDYKVVDELSPIEYEYPRIRDIILNRRKIDIIKNMQRDLLKKAENDNQIERYQ